MTRARLCSLLTRSTGGELKSLSHETSEIQCVQNVKLIGFDFVHSYDEQRGTIDTGYPRSIKDDFPGMRERDGDQVDEVDAATYKNGKEGFLGLCMQ